MSQQQSFGFGGSGGGGISGSGVTVGAVTADIITVPLGNVPGVYTFEIRVAGFNASTPAGIGASLFAAVRTDGTTATLIEIPDDVSNSETALDDAYGTVVISGNDAIVQVTGVTGLTIDWSADLFFTFRG